MITLDINRLDAIAWEYTHEQSLTELYVVKMELDRKYDDPMTCLVDINCHIVHEPQPFHQFWKFCHPVELLISEPELYMLKEQFLIYAVPAQRRLISLYDPDIYKRTEPISTPEAFQYVKQRLLLPLSEQEYLHIETGFRLRWNYSTGKKVGDGDFKRAVGQYLVTIDYPIELRKVNKVVDLIIEYLEWIGQWNDR